MERLVNLFWSFFFRNFLLSCWMVSTRIWIVWNASHILKQRMHMGVQMKKWQMNTGRITLLVMTPSSLMFAKWVSFHSSSVMWIFCKYLLLLKVVCEHDVILSCLLVCLASSGSSFLSSGPKVWRVEKAPYPTKHYFLIHVWMWDVCVTAWALCSLLKMKEFH